MFPSLTRRHSTISQNFGVACFSAHVNVTQHDALLTGTAWSILGVEAATNMTKGANTGASLPRRYRLYRHAFGLVANSCTFRPHTPTQDASHR